MSTRAAALPGQARVATYETRPLQPDRRAAIERHAGPRWLDVGCGNGAYVLALADAYDAHGFDQVAFDSWSRAPERFRTGDLARLPYQAESFDTVVCFETLEHVAEPEAALRQMAAIARRNVILTVPNCDVTPGMRTSGLAWHHYTDETHLQFFTLDAIAAVCESAGLRVVERSLVNEVSFAPLLREAFFFPLGWLGRVWPRRRRYFMTCLIVAECR